MDEILTWVPGLDLVPAEETRGPLLVADSWLVEDGRVRGLEWHRRRFTAGCADAAGMAEAMVAAFWRAAMNRLPRHGDLFPRAELIGGPEVRLRLRIRPAPQRGTQIRIWVPPSDDPRHTPRRKGPDLDVLGELRLAAMDAGADDALLISRSGLVLESGTASLMWWDDDRLSVPDPSLPILSGVTTRLIQQAATGQHIDVVHRRSRLDELDGREVWLVNALHGVRPVTAWVGARVSPGPADRAARWRQWWQAAAVPLQTAPLDSTTLR